MLNFVIKSANLKESRDQAINLIKTLNWENGFFRKDIGYKVIEQWELFRVSLGEKNYFYPLIKIHAH